MFVWISAVVFRLVLVIGEVGDDVVSGEDVTVSIYVCSTWCDKMVRMSSVGSVGRLGVALKVLMSGIFLA